MDIHRLSMNEQVMNPSDNALIMVGSFAPAHGGHIDAMESAAKALTTQNESLAATVFTPNSDSYVVDVKLRDSEAIWDFQRRVNGFRSLDIQTEAPSFVDDITGLRPPELSISEEAINTVSAHLGVAACRILLVVGSDQVDSMRPHLAQNRAICVMRPGSSDIINERMEEQWFRDAVADGRYILTDRKLTGKDISSTEVRNKLQLDAAMGILR